MSKFHTSLTLIYHFSTIAYGDYQWKSYGEVYKTSVSIASYLLQHNLCPQITNEDGTFRFISIYAKNREEWIETDLGCALSSITVVTLYDTLGKDSIEYILNQTKMKTLFLSAEKIKNILDLKSQGKIKDLTHMIYFDEASSEVLEKAKQIGIELIEYRKVVEMGSSITVDFENPTGDTVYTISYTSGTTGMPKGVMIMHKNFMSNCGGLIAFDGRFRFYDTDVYISYLPLAHAFERMLMLCCVVFRVQYGIYAGDVFKLNDDLAALKPTIMVSVPRLFTRFYDIMQSKVKELTGAKRRLCEWGIQKKLYNLEHYSKFTHPVYDALIFHKFKNILGGRMRQLFTGSAPISKDILNFLKIAFCCPIIEGYGQTECAAPATLTWMMDPHSGHVGAPIPSCDVKLVDVPDMNYTSEDRDDYGNLIPRGEICFKGPNCFKGYYDNPVATKETIDQDGWVHTGDIGMILPDGTVRIIDRKKNIFKLS